MRVATTPCYSLISAAALFLFVFNDVSTAMTAAAFVMTPKSRTTPAAAPHQQTAFFVTVRRTTRTTRRFASSSSSSSSSSKRKGESNKGSAASSASGTDEKKNKKNKSPSSSSCDSDLKYILQDEIDLERAKAKLESYDLYVIVSVLISAASLDVVKHFDLDSNSTVSPFVVLMAGLASLCGVHSTAVWALCALYGRSALGMKRDKLYDYLRVELSEIRRRGFATFSASLLLFSLEVGALLLYAVPQKYFFVSLALAATALFYIFYDWKFIYDTASVMFSGEPLPELKKAAATAPATSAADQKD